MGKKIAMDFFSDPQLKKKGLLKIPRAALEEVSSDEAKGRIEQLAVKRAGRCTVVVVVDGWGGGGGDIYFPAEAYPRLLFPTMWEALSS